MKVSYDPIADAVFIYFSNKKSTETREVGPNVLADFNGNDLVSIEVLEASKKLGKKDLEKLTFEAPNYGTSSV